MTTLISSDTVELCRNRLEEEMEADFEDVQRLIDRDVRLRRDTSGDKIHEAQHPDADVEAVSPTKDAEAKRDN